MTDSTERATDDALALIVVDMQLVAFDGKATPPITNGAQVLEAVAGLIRRSRDNRLPVVYVQTCAASGRAYARDFHGWEIHPRLARRRDDPVVYKSHSSGFTDTDLQEVLRQIGAHTLIVCGIWSEYCVANTCRDALRLGFGVCLAADAPGTVADSREAARATVERQNRELAQSGVAVRGVDDLFDRHAK